MESTTGRVPSSPLYHAEITGQIEDNDPDPESFELSDDELHFIQHSIKYAMWKLGKYRNLMERSVVYWAAMILHPGYGIGFLQLRLPNQVGSILGDFRDYFDRHYAQVNQVSRARITIIVNNFTVAMSSKSQAASCFLDDRQTEHE
jgi:hypothetical protein